MDYQTKAHNYLNSIGILIKDMKQLATKPDDFYSSVGNFMRSYNDLLKALNEKHADYEDLARKINFLDNKIQAYLIRIKNSTTKLRFFLSIYTP